ncbi:MAG: hypothetical protein WCK32_08425 [Chlorobiaceae bacterium]
MSAFDFGIKIDHNLFDRQINKGYQVNVSEYLRQGWELFKQNIGEFIGFTLIVFAISVASSKFNNFSSLLTTLLYAGFGIAAFKRMSGKQIQFSDFFSGFNYFLPLFLAELVMSVIVAVGFVFLILPGIYLAVSYTFTIFLIVDYRMEFWQAMEISRKIVTKQWFSIFWLCTVLFFLNLCGVLALGVGLLVTIPVSFCAMAFAYRDIIGLYSSNW